MQVYADNAATTRMSDKAVAAMTPYFQQFYGNPPTPPTSSVTPWASRPRRRWRTHGDG